ncbi:MAG TPA: galactokinase [Catalimonadaceae bacterium]|nr:galactokinase [Catalimonadaceae bacterium]
MSNETRKAFSDTYGHQGSVRTYFCPGRINLIGEHIDYNGGFVFPAALTLGITACISKREDGVVRFSSTTIPGTVEIRLNETLENKPSQHWANYPIGVLAFLQKEGYTLSGADVMFSSNLPDGAGVSSSAAIEVLTAFMFLAENGHPEPDRVWLSIFAQKVENQFIGVNCGIMDQFSVANGKAGQGILLNCNNLEFRYVPMNLGNYRLVILNTKKRRELADSKYNERRAECDEALAILNQTETFPDLCSATFDAVESLISDPVIRARATHVVAENQRVIEACKVLEAGNLERFGQLLNESHFSLRDLYAVTGKELDVITDAARLHPGCLGARMTGAGFGGCGIAIVDKESIPDFSRVVSETYEAACGWAPSVYVSEIGEGVRQLD